MIEAVAQLMIRVRETVKAKEETSFRELVAEIAHLYDMMPEDLERAYREQLDHGPVHLREGLSL